jgi:hypothetical protein
MRSTKIARQVVMDVRSRDGGVAGADGDLVRSETTSPTA